MSDGFSAELDIQPVVTAFGRLVEETHRLTQDACRETAQAIAREARQRLARQLGPNATGKTVAGIVAEPAYDGNGYVVMADRDPFPNLPLWLEKGTKPGKRRNYARVAPRPFFYSSIEVEAGAHERRILTALNDAGDASGLGM